MTLPLIEVQQQEFRSLIESKGGTASFLCEPFVRDRDIEDVKLITPHVVGFCHLQVTLDNVVAIGKANLEAYLAGEPLRNVVAR